MREPAREHGHAKRLTGERHKNDHDESGHSRRTHQERLPQYVGQYAHELPESILNGPFIDAAADQARSGLQRPCLTSQLDGGKLGCACRKGRNRMMSSLKTSALALFCSLFVIASCGSNSPTTPTTDFIALDSIVPAAGTALNAGERVTFTAVVTCTIVSSNSGFTVMVLQDQLNRSLLPPGESPPQAPLLKGTATVTLTTTVTIPPVA